MNIPTPTTQDRAVARIRAHARKYTRRKGVSEIRTRVKANMLFLDVVTEPKGSLVGRVFGADTVRGVGKLARLEYLQPNRWRLLVYKPDVRKYGPHPAFKEGTVEECLDAAAHLYLVH